MKTKHALIMGAITALLAFSTYYLYNAYTRSQDALQETTEALVAAEDRLESRFIYDKYVKDAQYANSTHKLQIRDRVTQVKLVTDTGISDASLNELRQYSKEVRQRAIELTD